MTIKFAPESKLRSSSKWWRNRPISRTPCVRRRVVKFPCYSITEDDASTALIAGLHGSQCKSSVQDNANYEIKVCRSGGDDGGGGSDSRLVENFRVKAIARAPLVKTSVIVGRRWLIRQVGGGIVKRRNALSRASEYGARAVTMTACVNAAR